MEQVSYYSGGSGPSELKQLVRTVYPKDKIDMVTKIRDIVKTIYGLVISRGLMMKTITVRDGLIEETDEFYKTNP